MEIKSSSYSPQVIIYLKFGDNVIRLADVLFETARLYTRDFDTIEPGTKADLVFSIDKEESYHSIILHEGLAANQDIFSFKTVNAIN